MDIATATAPAGRQLESAEVFLVDCAGSCYRRGTDPHVVVLDRKLNAWTCDCPAGLRHVICRHIREARLLWLNEGYERRKAEQGPDYDPFAGLVDDPR